MSDQLPLFTTPTFDLPKLSILDTRRKEWKERKQWWLNVHNIQSELGRNLERGNRAVFSMDGSEAGPSIFDPVLTELMYKWFTISSGSILDPFAGGSVRGIVAEELGYSYTGIELSPTQVEANMSQSSKPTWIVGDSNEVLDTLQDHQYDFLFSCPPYHDLEIYSDNPQDLSNMSWETFLTNYQSIISKSYTKMRDNTFAVFVVSEIREYSIKGRYTEGFYKHFIPSTINAFEAAGFKFYNDLVLLNSALSAGMVSNFYFDKNRKIASAHQNILVFVKGNPDLATIKITREEGVPCTVFGNRYESFREAGLSTNLPPTEVQRRCESRKLKYREFRLEEDQTPSLRYEIGGFLFESPQHAAKYIPLTDKEIYQRCLSSSRNWRHFIQLDEAVESMTYEDVDAQFVDFKPIPTDLPGVVCAGREFLTMAEAAEELGVSRERVRQKIKGKRFPDYYLL